MVYVAAEVAVVAASLRLRPGVILGGGALDKTRLRGSRARVCGRSSLWALRGRSGAKSQPVSISRVVAVARLGQRGQNRAATPNLVCAAGSRLLMVLNALIYKLRAIFFSRNALLYVYGRPSSEGKDGTSRLVKRAVRRHRR